MGEGKGVVRSSCLQRQRAASASSEWIFFCPWSTISFDINLMWFLPCIVV